MHNKPEGWQVECLLKTLLINLIDQFLPSLSACSFLLDDREPCSL